MYYSLGLSIVVALARAVTDEWRSGEGLIEGFKSLAVAGLLPMWVKLRARELHARSLIRAEEWV